MARRRRCSTRTASWRCRCSTTSMTGPDALAADYDAVRPPFAETGTPRLPIGLNLGAQLFWQARSISRRSSPRSRRIVTYPQYWAYRLSGVLANEVTSLGCHTDLWNPARGDYSRRWSTRMGWRQLMAPVRTAGDRLGPILPDIAPANRARPPTRRSSAASTIPTPRCCRICCRASRRSPSSRPAPGSSPWRSAARRSTLDPARDTLVNVNALGDPVPSARFMGGREFSTLVDAGRRGLRRCRYRGMCSTAAIMLLPSVQQGSGPFPDRASSWIGDGDRLAPAQRFAAVSLLPRDDDGDLPRADRRRRPGRSSRVRSRGTGSLARCWRRDRTRGACRRTAAPPAPASAQRCWPQATSSRSSELQCAIARRPALDARLRGLFRRLAARRRLRLRRASRRASPCAHPAAAGRSRRPGSPPSAGPSRPSRSLRRRPRHAG